MGSTDITSEDRRIVTDRPHKVYFYVATSKEYVDLAITSALSLRVWVPDADIRLVTDRVFTDPGPFTHVIDKYPDTDNEVLASRSLKFNLWRLLNPSEVGHYVDADSLFLAPPQWPDHEYVCLHTLYNTVSDHFVHLIKRCKEYYQKYMYSFLKLSKWLDIPYHFGGLFTFTSNSTWMKEWEDAVEEYRKCNFLFFDQPGLSRVAVRRNDLPKVRPMEDLNCAMHSWLDETKGWCWFHFNDIVRAGLNVDKYNNLVNDLGLKEREWPIREIKS